jgi:hypothetical protein
MASEEFRVKTDLLMSLVTKVIPDVPRDAFFMDDLSVRIAAMIDPAPQEELVDKVFVEIISCYYLALLANFAFFKRNIHEAGFLKEAVRIVITDKLGGSFPDVFAKPEKIGEKVTQYMTIIQEHYFEEDFLILVTETVVANLVGKKKPKKKMVDEIDNWIRGGFDHFFELFKSIAAEHGLISTGTAGEEAQVLIAKMKDKLPIPVKVSPDFMKELRKHGLKTAQTGNFKIVEVFDSGEAGGIMCLVRGSGNTQFGASLTHLQIKGDHPLKEEIERYQTGRVKKLSDTNNVYQFKITLDGISPPIWRRIQVPGNYTFFDLHVAIQDAMGWQDYHLHSFTITDPRSGEDVELGMPDDDLFGETLPGWEHRISDYFTLENKKAEYVYDFGDDWTHKVVLEKILPAEPGVEYPICTAGKRACPPEDVGGIYGYMDFLDVINNPNDEQYKDMLQWAGGKFDPEHFNPKEVKFREPKEAFEMMMSPV